MDAGLVNLRQFKKRKARRVKEENAENNRIAFGRTRLEKIQTREINKQQELAHQNGRLEKPPGNQPPK